ncbi:hypothetical protein GSH05_17755 [Burkholderia pseudomallei]|uniref:hypothetical protein n=1 Tax=Burkholderia pseudomallei TaxID=28450 RepID=UPI000B1ED4DE|nr:hypothetical protein [Burkholderia pseudomallei]MBF3652113.1 hypothetical protein [Burkholderia pseudomallei]MBF3669887.1 hypothetical protein [Burkholderia pseudomallei]MBF3775116.1 hypothetical protein [Burkholderia pseudomallei]MBF3873449.1 hypothetical protein [Burkholderia pseudomallei]MBF3909817.1 hypothetical protein [Burkholderia pseudomallei]
MIIEPSAQPFASIAHRSRVVRGLFADAAVRGGYRSIVERLPPMNGAGGDTVHLAVGVEWRREDALSILE